MASEKEKSAGSNENVLSLLDGLGHFCSPVEQNHKTLVLHMHSFRQSELENDVGSEVCVENVPR